MKVVYLHIPTLADKRNIIIDGTRIINTAAPASGVIHLCDHGRARIEIEELIQEPEKAEAPQ